MVWSSQNKKRNKGFGLKKVSKSLRKKASQAGYKAANASGYVAGRTTAKIAKTPKLRNTVGKIAPKLPKKLPGTKPPSIRTQGAFAKGVYKGTYDGLG
jgi:hypothetical protein